MFDLSFGKLFLLLIIGLIVLGPTRLPVVIKKVASWIRALQRITSSVQMEINKELKLQEIQETLKKASELDASQFSPEMQKTVDDLKQVIQSLQQNVDDSTAQMNQHIIHTTDTEEKLSAVKEIVESTPVDNPTDGNQKNG